MKRSYSKPIAKKIKIDKQISIFMLTNEGNPPGGPPFGGELIIKKKDNPYKA